MIVIKSGRQPFEVMILTWCLLASIFNASNYQQAASSVLVRTVPPLFGYTFYIGMAVSAAIALVGVFLPNLTGPLIERAGLWMLIGFWLPFGVLILAVGDRGAYFGGVLFGLAGAAFWRGVQIGREQKAVRAAAAVTGSTDHVEDG